VVKVKLCGNQSVDDVEITSGANAQGFIVMTDSAREIQPEMAAELMEHVPLFNAVVLVTATTDPFLISDLAEVLEPHAVQIHAELGPVQIERIRRALSVRIPLYTLLSVDEDLEACLERAQRLAGSPLDALLLDSRVGDQTGGTGTVHNWENSARIREMVSPLPVILAGGITPQNVQEAIETVQPYAIDVASGVETDGHKDPQKVKALLERVKNYDS